MDLRKQLQITDTDILSPLYDILERQYEDIKHQKDNIENIEILTESINNTKEQLNELEQDNQKVEILALLREFCIIDTYMDPTEPTSLEKNIPEVEQESSVTTTTDSPSIFESTKDTTTSTNQTLAPQSPQSQMTENALPNEVVLITNPTNIDLEFVHAKANKVMKRVGEMLGIKTEETKIVNVSNKPTPPEEPIPESIPTTPSKEENPLFNNEFPDFKESVSEEEKSTPEENNFWFPSDTPDALNELPDLEIANNNFFADNNMPDLNFPDLKINYDENNMEEER